MHFHEGWIRVLIASVPVLCILFTSFQEKHETAKPTAPDKTNGSVPDDSMRVLRKDGKEIITLRKDIKTSDLNRTIPGTKSNSVPVTNSYNETKDDTMTKVDIMSNIKIKQRQKEELISKQELRLLKASRPSFKPTDADITDNRRITVLPL